MVFSPRLSLSLISGWVDHPSPGGTSVGQVRVRSGHLDLTPVSEAQEVSGVWVGFGFGLGQVRSWLDPAADKRSLTSAIPRVTSPLPSRQPLLNYQWHHQWCQQSQSTARFWLDRWSMSVLQLSESSGLVIAICFLLWTRSDKICAVVVNDRFFCFLGWEMTNEDCEKVECHVRCRRNSSKCLAMHDNPHRNDQKAVFTPKQGAWETTESKGVCVGDRRYGQRQWFIVF